MKKKKLTARNENHAWAVEDEQLFFANCISVENVKFIMNMDKAVYI